MHYGDHNRQAQEVGIGLHHGSLQSVSQTTAQTKHSQGTETHH